MPVLASYAAGVALNNFLPANIGTFVTLLMYVAIVRGSTFPGMLAGYVVQKIFYFIIGTLIYIYLFWAIAGSFEFQFGDERDAITNHPVLDRSASSAARSSCSSCSRGSSGAGSRRCGRGQRRARRSSATCART